MALLGETMIRSGLTILILLSLVGCSNTNVLQPSASKVRIDNNIKNKTTCTYLGEVIGSEGVLYNYLFISNHDLTMGARNDLRNKAHALGGNIIEIENYRLGYQTSTVYVGNVYHCKEMN